MIKEKLMKALEVAAADYNSGMSANAAVVKAASAADFNEHQTERLVEMFNTLAAINKEKDANDPTGSCELASKDEVLKELIDAGSSMSKAASAPIADVVDYSFYMGEPSKTNLSIEARHSGVSSMMKAASSEEMVDDEINVSQRSLYKIISDKIELVKSAADAADEAARAIRLFMQDSAVKIAKAIEDPFASPDMADMFKAACQSEKVVEMVGEYSTKVAESDGGRFASMAVFDSSQVDDLLKIACQMDELSSQLPGYEKKRDFYIAKAADAEKAMKEILGLSGSVKKASVADFFNPESVVKKAGDGAQAYEGSGNSDASISVKIAEIIRKSGIESSEVMKLADDLEKDAARINTMALLPSVSVGDAIGAIKGKESLSDEEIRLQNKIRGLILEDIIPNDPILRDADPNVVSEIYKSVVRSSPRISMDPALLKSVLRASVNSVALSPADAKILTDVEKGIALSNVERLSNLDSSIKDSNRA